MPRLRIVLAAALTLLALAAPTAASAALTAQQQDVALPSVQLPSMTFVPRHFKVDGGQALSIAMRSPQLRQILREKHSVQANVRLWIGSHYDVLIYYHHKPLADVVVEKSGRLGPTWTGPYIIGVYARGNYLPLFDTPWVCIPFGLAFLFPFLVRRRRGLGLVHLDLAVILSWGISYWLFNHRHLEASVWMFYPPLLYLLGRMLYVLFRPGARRPAPQSWLSWQGLLVGLLVLEGVRIALALIQPNLIDVGVASLIGAYRILHGLPIYFPSAGHPDTYGPVTYLFYLPFEAIWPWTGVWNHVWGARAAAITVDLSTIAALFALGKQLRPGVEGRKLGLLLGWLWAACPFTLLGLMLSTNDGIVALLLVLCVLALNSPAGRGAMVGLAAAAKFFPAILLPVVLAGHGRAERRGVSRALIGFFVAAAGPIAILLPPGGIQEVWDHSIGFQLTRQDVSSIWALHPGLKLVKDAVTLAALSLAVILALRPRGERTTAQVSAAMAAVIIAVELPAMHWFFVYIPWFLALVFIAILAGSDTGRIDGEDPAAPAEQAAEPAPKLATAGV